MAVRALGGTAKARAHNGSSLAGMGRGTALGLVAFAVMQVLSYNRQSASNDDRLQNIVAEFPAAHIIALQGTGRRAVHFPAEQQRLRDDGVQAWSMDDTGGRCRGRAQRHLGQLRAGDLDDAGVVAWKGRCASPLGAGRQPRCRRDGVLRAASRGDGAGSLPLVRSRFGGMVWIAFLPKFVEPPTQQRHSTEDAAVCTCRLHSRLRAISDSYPPPPVYSRPDLSFMPTKCTRPIMV